MQSSSQDSLQLLEDPLGATVDALCEQLALRRVGWIFTDLTPGQGEDKGKMKCTRNPVA